MSTPVMVRRFAAAARCNSSVCTGLYTVSITTVCGDQSAKSSIGLAYNLGNFLRRLALPPRVRNKLIKIGAKVVHHARRVVFQMAEEAIPRTLFAAILRRIERLCLLAPAPT